VLHKYKYVCDSTGSLLEEVKKQIEEIWLTQVHLEMVASCWIITTNIIIMTITIIIIIMIVIYEPTNWSFNPISREVHRQNPQAR